MNLTAQRLTEIIMMENAPVIARLLDENPEVDPVYTAQVLSAEVVKFLDKAGPTHHKEAPQALRKALEDKGLNVMHKDIAWQAFKPNRGTHYYAITETPTEAREVAKEFKASNGWNVIRWNRGSYIVVLQTLKGGI